MTAVAPVASGQQVDSPMEMDIAPPDLKVFDDLLSSKDDYDDQENASVPHLGARRLERTPTRLGDYDEHLGMPQHSRTSGADNPRDASQMADRRAISGHRVPRRVDNQGGERGAKPVARSMLSRGKTWEQLPWSRFPLHGNAAVRDFKRSGSFLDRQDNPLIFAAVVATSRYCSMPNVSAGRDLRMERLMKSCPRTKR